ncbi:hypothetical protein BM531_20545, partial [Clostridioides difficile]
IYQTEKTLNELGDKISSGEKEDIEKAIADLKAVKDNQDATAEELKKATDEVMTKFQKVSQEMYQKAAQEQ